MIKQFVVSLLFVVALPVSSIAAPAKKEIPPGQLGRYIELFNYADLSHLSCSLSSGVVSYSMKYLNGGGEEHLVEEAVKWAQKGTIEQTPQKTVLTFLWSEVPNDPRRPGYNPYDTSKSSSPYDKDEVTVTVGPDGNTIQAIRYKEYRYGSWVDGTLANPKAWTGYKLWATIDCDPRKKSAADTKE